MGLCPIQNNFESVEVPKIHLLCVSASSPNLRWVKLPKFGLRQLMAEGKPAGA